jgi:hypothetical protein
MTWPPKAKRAPAKSALQKLQLLAAYRTAAILTTSFGWPFWISEQWRGRLADRIDNEEHDR